MPKKQTQNLTSYGRIRPEIKKPYTQFYLIRHGHPDYSKMKKLGDFGMPLSAIGQKQRDLLINKKLLAVKIDVVYSSQLTRAIQTAGPFAEKIGKETIIDKKLNEIDWQDWYKIKFFNMSEKTRIKKISHYKKLDKQLDKIQARGRRTLADIYHKHKGKNIALFCHGNLIRSILTGILNTDIIGFLSMEIYQSSVSKIVIDRDGYVKINYINSIRHLPRKPNEDLFTFALNQ